MLPQAWALLWQQDESAGKTDAGSHLLSADQINHMATGTYSHIHAREKKLKKKVTF